uniref:Uncharacterized protein n=1 Tax=viral metagenome TaxID=1070528 RepID=A0A6C0KQT3_9ZZZZ
MLTAKDRRIIDNHTVTGPTERYPEVPIYVFKGLHAFQLHSRMVHLVDDWEGRFTETEKEKCMLLVTLQTTISKAALAHPERIPVNPRRRILLYFYSKEEVVPSAVSYTSTKGKKWRRMLEDEPNNLL